MDKAVGAVLLILIMGVVVFLIAPVDEVVPTDPSELIEVRNGGSFTIMLEGKSSDGMAWVQVTVTDRVESIGGDYREVTGSEEYDAMEYKTFKALRAGNVTLEFAYIDLERGVWPSDERREFQIDVR